jgi:hypothetical protein
MSASMPSLEEYQAFVYTLAASFPFVESSTLVIRWVDDDTRWITGEIFFAHDVRLHVSEVINFSRRAIVSYGYELYRGDERLYWYDSQPHPDDPSLASTHPHHKHIPPDIKHHRLPAPELSFNHPNIPFLIGEIEELLRISGS